MAGRIERVDDTTLLITELPVRTWTQNYKEFLEKMMVADDKTKEIEIRDFKENHTDSTVCFTVTADKNLIDEWEKLPKGGLYAKFKLTGSLTNSNMHLFDTENRISKYFKPEDILREFFDLRLDFYERRKDLLVKKLQREQKVLSNKARFVEEVCSGELVVSNRKKTELLQDLQERGYELFDKSEKQQGKDLPEEEETEEEEPTVAALAKGYEYLLGMKIWSLTYEKAEELREQLRKRTEELKELEATSPSQLWLKDLEEIELALDERDIEIENAQNEEAAAMSKRKKRQTTNVKKATLASKRSKKKADEWDSELEESDDESVRIEVAKKPVARRQPASSKQSSNVLPSKPMASSQSLPRAEPKEVIDVEMSLSERMALLLSPSKTPPTSAHQEIEVFTSAIENSESSDESSRGTKRPSPRNGDLEDDFKLDSSSKAKKPRQKKTNTTKAAPKKATKATTKAKPKTATKAPARKAAISKADSHSDSSDDEFALGEEDDRNPAPVRAGGARAARAATKKVTYTVDSDDDSDF